MRVRAGLLAVAVLIMVGTTGGCADGDGQPSGVPHPNPTRPALAPDAVDFNGDGVRDTVKGHPDATVELARRAGTVTVTYGSRSGKADKDSGSAEPQQSACVARRTVVARVTGGSNPTSTTAVQRMRRPEEAPLGEGHPFRVHLVSP
ncbi:hypothetical protein ACFYPZ_04075 [Streptomyces sp. NPDC005506]|uniref:hypothetical protein n=1 Tax=Streptomyces sp. NPDC005506 TaxID=3364718 RepID=UPI0036A013D7